MLDKMNAIFIVFISFIYMMIFLAVMYFTYSYGFWNCFDSLKEIMLKSDWALYRLHAYANLNTLMVWYSSYMCNADNVLDSQIISYHDVFSYNRI